MKKVENEVQVKQGEIEYETLILEDIEKTTPTKASDNEYGRIEEKRQLYAKIVYPSGRTVWVREESVIYPEAYR